MKGINLSCFKISILLLETLVDAESTPSCSLDLHFSVFQNRPDRGALICSKLCSQLHFNSKKMKVRGIREGAFSIRRTETELIRSLNLLLFLSKSFYLGWNSSKHYSGTTELAFMNNPLPHLYCQFFFRGREYKELKSKWVRMFLLRKTPIRYLQFDYLCLVTKLRIHD